VFSAARTALDLPAPTLLSFGCSTGEELISLRRYFPESSIVGTDINPRCLRAARRLCRGDARIDVRCIDELEGQFDAIFCMAVFQRGELRDEQPADASGIYPFERFEAELEELDQHLRVGGVLAVDEASYRVGDTTLGARYEPLPCTLSRERIRPRYDQNSRLLGVCPEAKVLWRKRMDASARRRGQVRGRLRAFASKPFTEQRRLLEAAVLLEALVGLVRALPFRVVARSLGLRAEERAPSASDRDLARARELADCVRRAARHVPFPAVCLPQALALSAMLSLRGIASTLRLGVKRDRAQLLAHAWVVVGEEVVLGGFAGSEYQTVGSFA
jgi:SAM-dependent methyltransferase